MPEYRVFGQHLCRKIRSLDAPAVFRTPCNIQFNLRSSGGGLDNLDDQRTVMPCPFSSAERAGTVRSVGRRYHRFPQKIVGAGGPDTSGHRGVQPNPCVPGGIADATTRQRPPILHRKGIRWHIELQGEPSRAAGVGRCVGKHIRSERFLGQIVVQLHTGMRGTTNRQCHGRTQILVLHQHLELGGGTGDGVTQVKIHQARVEHVDAGYVKFVIVLMHVFFTGAGIHWIINIDVKVPARHTALNWN